MRRCIVCDELYDAKLRRCPTCFGPDEPEQPTIESHAGADGALDAPLSPYVGAIALAVIVLVSAVLRFWELGRKSLWLDELFTASVTGHGPLAAFAADVSDTNPPLYYMLQSMVSPFLGRSDAAMRVLPAVLGVATTAVIYFAGKRIFGRKAGLCAAALFAIAPIAVQYGQEARMYSLLMLGCSLELLAFAALVEKPNPFRAGLLACALAIVAYTHVYGYMAAGLLIVPVLAIPRLRKRVGRMFGFVAAGALVLFIPWAMAVPVQIQKVRSAAAQGNWWMGAPSEVFSAFVDNLTRLAPSVSLVPAGTFLGLLINGSHGLERLETDDADAPIDDEARLNPVEAIVVLLTVALAPVFIGLVVSKYITPIATLRNSLVALPALCLLAARGALRLPRWAMVSALSVLLLFSLVALPGYYAESSKGQWHAAAEYVFQTDPKPVVVTEDYENALELTTYADILGEGDEMKLKWMSNSVSSDTGTVTVLAFDSSTVGPLRTFLAGEREVFVISRDSESKVDEVLATMPEWRRDRVQEFRTAPYIRIWKRSSEATATP